MTWHTQQSRYQPSLPKTWRVLLDTRQPRHISQNNPKVLDICQFGPGVTSITVTSSRGGPIDYHRYRSEMEPPDNSVTYSHEIFRIFGSLFILLNNLQLTILTICTQARLFLFLPNPGRYSGSDIVVTREPVKSNKSAAAVRVVRVVFHQIRLINERML